MNNQPTSRFLTLQIIHGALCLGVALFLAVTIFLNQGKSHTDIEPGDVPLLYVVIALAISGPFLSGFLYQAQLKQIDFAAPVERRFAQYQTASIIRYALLEAPAMLAVVVWFITRNQISAIIAAAIILLMILSRPIKSKVAETLKVSYPETLD